MKLPFTLFACLMISYAQAQFGVVRGRLFDTNQSPQAGLTVRLENTAFATSTDGDGTFFLEKITTAPLPVTLLYFTAKPEGDRVQLAWATTQEINADHFRVEHSLDLAEYTPAGDVTAKGTTDERQVYGLTDLNPQPGINYYRLKQVDRDGATQYFKPVSATIQRSEPVVTVYPNPADSDRIHLRLWNADDAHVRLLTIAGQSIGGQLQRTPGQADFLPVQPLSAGFYWLEVTTNNQRRTTVVLVR